MSSNQETSDQPSAPPLCANGCGFFASMATAGLCSKCYRENCAQQKKQEEAQRALAALQSQANAAKPTPQPQPEPAAAPVPEPPAAAAASVAPVEEVASTSGAGQEPPAAPCPTRCFQCRKKTGLTGFKCRCGQNFCGTHRYAEAHNCTFDYKTMGREQLATNNPLVQASKVAKI